RRSCGHRNTGAEVLQVRRAGTEEAAKAFPKKPQKSAGLFAPRRRTKGWNKHGRLLPLSGHPPDARHTVTQRGASHVEETEPDPTPGFEPPAGRPGSPAAKAGRVPPGD